MGITPQQFERMEKRLNGGGRVAAPLLESGLKQGSLSLTLADLGLSAAGGSETASVLPALSPVDAAIMGRPPRQPMLRLERVTRDDAGAVLEYVDSILDPVHFGLRIAF